MTTAAKKTFGNRKFYSLPEDYSLRAANPRSRPTQGTKKPEETAKLLKYIDDSVIGKNATFSSPFGKRKVVYCDYTASGRSLQFVEDYILREVLPSYGNTHTTTSITSQQSTLFRHEARDIFRNAVNASEHDAVIFAGHGCTGAVHKLLHALNLTTPVVVFVGPSEHHSNLLPWREQGATIVRIGETRDGFLDLLDLEHQLQTHHGQGVQLIGCFSAASNVTGILADDITTTMILHQYGALAFWDYAAAAPYVKLDMNPILPNIDERSVAKDAMFFSVHKFVGGVQTPGVLIAKKALFRNDVPNGCGGGTVFFVTQDSHRYLQDTELREEGGTAAVVESVRAGLAMQLKESIGVPAIMAREDKITRMVLSHVRTIPELILLGPSSGSLKRLPIFSFMVRHPRGTFLHHNFVCMVLNDVFGIQARGGCACAGPYAQDLMGIDQELAQEFENVLLEDRRLDRMHLRRHEEHSSYEMLRPGFARISLPYFMTDGEVAFVLEALKMVATEAWKLLPQYIVNPETGEWRHHTNLTFKDRKWLGSIRYIDGKMSVCERRVSGAGTFPPDYAECLRSARGLCSRARKMAQRCPLPDQKVMFDGTTERLRWFMLPSEAQDLLLGQSQNVKHTVPFDPNIPLSDNQLSPSHNNSFFEKSPLVNPPYQSIEPTRSVSQSSIHFAVGDIVNAVAISPRILQIPRGRCYSLGSDAVFSLPVDTHIANLSPDSTRLCDSSSQTDLKEMSQCMGGASFNGLNALHSNSVESYLGDGYSAEGLSAYVREMTKDIATEIKSEIREVISQVEDVLSESQDNCDGYNCNYLGMEKNTVEKERGGSVSVSDVMEYLIECSREMASEVKSEIRSAVEVLTTPEVTDHHFAYNKLSDLTQSSECSSEETVIHVASGDTKADDTDTEETQSLNAEHKQCALMRSTINSVSSQDSGINLMFQDSDCVDDKPRRRKMNISKAARSAERYVAGVESGVALNDSDSITMGAEILLSRWHCPTKAIWKPAVEALHEFDMIRDGDRVMVCLSGGKDSLSLLHTLHQFQFYARSKGIHFSLGAATVDPGSTAYDPRPLIPYLASLGVHYLYEEQPIIQMAASLSEACSSVCSFCSRMKRGRLYAAARANNYNVLALGQHLDDLVESFFMSAFHNGRLRSMKAHYHIRQKDLRVVRPFVYVREKALRQFAESRNLPVIAENCPACFEAPKERFRSKQLLAQQEILFPKLFWSLRTALHPLISFRNTGEEALAFSRQHRLARAQANMPHIALSDTDEEEV